MTSDTFAARRRPETGGGYGQSNLKAGTGKGGAWAGYHNQGGAYNQGAQQQHQQHQLTNGATANIPLPAAVRGVEEASAVTEYVLRCASAAIEHQQATQQEVEAVLSKLCSLITLPVSPQVSQMLANSALPSAVVRTIRRYQNEAPCAALACVVAVKSTGSTEGAASHIRAGALDEVNNLMDAHPSHGGVQNVSLLMLAGLVKDNAAARTAVASGSVNRVLKAMELTTGREVQSNGLAALRLLLDSGRNNRAFLQDNPRAPRANLQEAALRAKVSHQSDNSVCSSANDVLALVTPRFKEVMCWHWQSGWCKLGPRCTYAHGGTDLRGGGTGVSAPGDRGIPMGLPQAGGADGRFGKGGAGGEKGSFGGAGGKGVSDSYASGAKGGAASEGGKGSGIVSGTGNEGQGKGSGKVGYNK